MKFLYFGDKHERVTTPENRLDHFVETQKKKTEEILELGKKYGVRAFLQPGDFFDTPQPPLDFVSNVVEQWTSASFHRVFLNYLEKEKNDHDVTDFFSSHTPIVGVAGNHELFGNNLKTLDKTMIGFLSKMGFIRFATKEDPVFFRGEDGVIVAITGTHYHINMDHPEHIEDDYVVKEKLGDIHIHIVHGFLTDKDLGPLIPHVRIDQIAHTKADLTITGHDHIGFPLTEIDGKYFVNPGAVVRLSNHPKEIARTPKVLLIEATKEGLRVEEVPLSSAAKGEEVLSREKAVAKQEKAMLLQRYKETVQQSDWETKGVDVLSIVRSLPEDDKEWKRAKDNLLLMVAKKEEELRHHSQEVNHAYIEKIEIENFQSHEHSVIECAKGFNIFVGESKQGKTAVLRALSWVYENKPTGKRIVRQGANYARVTLSLSNGYKISRLLETKRGGKNGYEVTTPDGETSFYNTKSLDVIQPFLGFSLVPIDKDVTLNLNFLKQGKGWFLIGDEYSAPLRAKIIGSICGVQYADAALRELEAEEKRHREKEKWLKKEVESIDEQISEYEHVKDLQQILAECEEVNRKIEALEQRKERVIKVVNRYELVRLTIQELNEVIQQSSSLDEKKELLVTLKGLVEDLFRIEKLTSKRVELLFQREKVCSVLEQIRPRHEMDHHLSSLKRESEKLLEVSKLCFKYDAMKQSLTEQRALVEKLSSVPRLMKGIDVLKERIEDFEKLLTDYEKTTTLLAKKQRLERGLVAIREVCERTKTLHVAKKEKTQAETLFGTYETSAKLISKMFELKQKQISLSKEIKDQEKVIDLEKRKYAEMLSAYGKCPICHGDLRADRIKQVVDDLFV